MKLALRFAVVALAVVAGSSALASPARPGVDQVQRRAVPGAATEPLFAFGATNVSNGVFFPGTAIYDGNAYQGMPPYEIERGTDIQFINLDVAVVANGHQIKSLKTRRGKPLFQSDFVAGPGEDLMITSHLKPGVYVYFCTTHSGMFGRIAII